MFTLEKVQKFSCHLLNLLRELKEISQNNKFDISFKSDGTRITTGDVYSDEKIKQYIKDIFGNHIIISEEDDQKIKNKNLISLDYFLIDPIDGTSYFIKQENFCINIAYCINHVPVFGLVVDSCDEVVYFSNENNIYVFDGINLKPIIPKTASKNITVCLSINDLVKKNEQSIKFFTNVQKNYNISSINIKGVCRKYIDVISGNSDVAIAFNTVMDWDIASIFVFAKILGYHMLNNNGQEFVFGTGDLKHANHVLLSNNINLITV